MIAEDRCQPQTRQTEAGRLRRRVRGERLHIDLSHDVVRATVRGFKHPCILICIPLSLMTEIHCIGVVAKDQWLNARREAKVSARGRRPTEVALEVERSLGMRGLVGQGER